MAPLLITHFVVDGWQVIGGAGSFQLPKRLLSVVESGLKDVVSHANALFISGGLHSGVFRVIGELVSSLESNTPLIGVSTLECIKSHELLRSPGDGSDVVAVEEHRSMVGAGSVRPRLQRRGEVAVRLFLKLQEEAHS